MTLPLPFGIGTQGLGAPVFGSGIGSTAGLPSLGSSPGTGLDLGNIGRYGLMAASMMPGPIGMLGTLGNLGLHGYNLGTTNSNLNALGLPSLGFGQTLGAMLGMNGYANGSPMGLAQAIGAQMPAAAQAAMAGRANAMSFGANPGGGFVGPGSNPAGPGLSASEGANNGMAAGPV